MNNKIKKLSLLYFSLITLSLLSSCTIPQPENSLDINKKETNNIKEENNTKKENAKQKEMKQEDVEKIKNLDITFSEDDISKFKKELKSLEQKISEQKEGITFEQIIQKARYLDYIGNQKEAIKTYLDNSEKYSTSIIFKHNLGDLYERVGEYNKAIAEYEFIIKNKKDYKYLDNLEKLYEKVGNKEKLRKIKLLKSKLKK